MSKAVIYATDGTGRDTYISFNNGGNTAMYEPNAKNIIMGQMRSSNYKFESPSIAPKTIHYN